MSRKIRLAGLLAALLLIVGAITPGRPALFLNAPSSSPALNLAGNNISAPPYAGFNTYYAIGQTPTQTYMQDVSDFLVSSGLQAAWGGTVVAELDEGWEALTANVVQRSGGNPLPSAQFSSIPAMVSHITGNGQIAGTYRDGGRLGCSGEDWGSGTLTNDLQYFLTTWGFAVVKTDGCGLFSGTTPIASGRTIYTGAEATMLATGLPYIQMFGYSAGTFSGSTPGWVYGPRTGGAWRFSLDIGEPTPSVCSTGFDFLTNANHSVMNNVWAAVYHPGVVGPYHFVDADYLMPNNNGVGGTLTTDEAITQMALAAVLSSPWMIGCDPRNIGTTELATLKNADLISILKDAWVVGGYRITGQNGTPGYGDANTYEIYCKRLQGTGKRAIVAVNENKSSVGAQTITIDPALCGIDTTQTYTFKNVLTGTTTTGHTSTFSSGSINYHASGVFIVSAGTENNATCWATNPGGTSQLTDGRAGGCAFTSDNNGATAQGAGSFPLDGTTVSTATAINTSADLAPTPRQGCYQKQRKGVISGTDANEAAMEYYAGNLVSGAIYAYYIDFAEIEGNTTGQRLFNLTINTGTQSIALLTGYDIFANAGGANKAVVVTGTVLADHGYISFDFEPISPPTGVPTVGCIEVIKQ